MIHRDHFGRAIEGYWYSKSEEIRTGIVRPIPKPKVLTKDEAKEIFELIFKKQKSAKEIRYRGFSGSRITGERLGSTEWQTTTWLWPADFGTHYVLEHRCRPTDEFLKYIGYSFK